MRLQRTLTFTVGAILSTSVDVYAQQAGRCEAAKAESVIGQQYSLDLAERAARSAGAREARKLTRQELWAGADLPDDDRLRASEVGRGCNRRRHAVGR